MSDLKILKFGVISIEEDRINLTGFHFSGSGSFKDLINLIVEEFNRIESNHMGDKHETN